MNLVHILKSGFELLNYWCVVFIQELVSEAVRELEGSIIEDEKMSGLLSETQANIDQHHSMLRELSYLQVDLCRYFLCNLWDFSSFCLHSMLSDYIT